jgi:hypothetical protein
MKSSTAASYSGQYNYTRRVCSLCADMMTEEPEIQETRIDMRLNMRMMLRVERKIVRREVKLSKRKAYSPHLLIAGEDKHDFYKEQ